MEYLHKSVLLKESIDGLDIHDGDTYIDGTLGSGGHAEYALSKVKDLRVVGLDRDIDALKRSRERLGESENIILKEASYSDIESILDELEIERVDRVMLDLGLSSDQFEISGRGFTFKKDEPLLMTFQKSSEALSDTNPNLTAYQIVNTWEESNIADIIYGYGEEKFARRIAGAISRYREKKKIETTSELSEIVSQSVPVFYRKGRIHPTTKTFQALRIAVNDELNTLKKGLVGAWHRLAKDGRIAVISFHSLEDRIVKNFNKEKEEVGEGKIVVKKPIVPTEFEIAENPRSRSAKLRIIEKLI